MQLRLLYMYIHVLQLTYVHVEAIVHVLAHAPKSTTIR